MVRYTRFILVTYCSGLFRHWVTTLLLALRERSVIKIQVLVKLWT